VCQGLSACTSRPCMCVSSMLLRPNIVSKETQYSVKIDLISCQKSVYPVCSCPPSLAPVPLFPRHTHTLDVPRVVCAHFQTPYVCITTSSVCVWGGGGGVRRVCACTAHEPATCHHYGHNRHRARRAWLRADRGPSRAGGACGGGRGSCR